MAIAHTAAVRLYTFRAATTMVRAAVHPAQGWRVLRPRVTARPLKTRLAEILMASHFHTPHFHNEPGVPTIRVGVKEFMCTGALPPFDHPHVFIDMGDSDDAVCPYCSTRYLFQASLGAGCDPAACEYHPDTAP